MSANTLRICVSLSSQLYTKRKHQKNKPHPSKTNLKSDKSSSTLSKLCLNIKQYYALEPRKTSKRLRLSNGTVGVYHKLRKVYLTVSKQIHNLHISTGQCSTTTKRKWVVSTSLTGWTVSFMQARARLLTSIYHSLCTARSYLLFSATQIKENLWLRWFLVVGKPRQPCWWMVGSRSIKRVRRLSRWWTRPDRPWKCRWRSWKVY